MITTLLNVALHRFSNMSVPALKSQWVEEERETASMIEP